MLAESFQTTQVDKPFRPFHIVLAGALLLAAVGAVYRDVVPSWVTDLWTDPNYSHGLLVPAVSVWLAYQRRDELLALAPKPALSAIVLIAFALLLFAAGGLAAELFTTRLSMVVLLCGLVAFILGYGYLRVLALSIGFLFFMVPLPTVVFNAIAFPLQLLASQFAIAVLHALGMPALGEGNVIMLPNTSLEVAEACSGLRSLISLGATSFLIAAVSLRRPVARLALVLLSVPVAVLMNAVRVSGTGILAYHFGPSVAEGFFHGFSGWLIFLAALASLGMLAALLRRLEA